jgi:UDP-N-acetylglucosamine--N-acetylmuramyl-(pentapeptide) pyrophosphoryl-undecaprenol N-acetylglucosamine transferase
MKKLKRVLIMAGGTGGHIFPGLAVAHYLREQGVDVHWLGTHHGLEARLVPEAKFPLHVVKVTGVRGKGVKTLLSAPFKVTQAIHQARKIIKRFQPDIVIGFGGFVSGPGGIASWMLGCPLVIHEQNAKAGLTNRLLAQIAKRVLAGFPGAFPESDKVVVLGNPVRAEIENIPAPQKRNISVHSPFRLLVIGGSLGAQALNDVVPKALAALPETSRPDVYHQSGDKLFEKAKIAYESIGIRVDLVPFVKDMAAAYEWADLVICRAGALTVSELCAAGVAAILVPLPWAVDDHQSANAAYMTKHHAALCVKQTELTGDRLASIIRQYMEAPEQCLQMAEAAYRLRQVQVAEKIFGILMQII